MVVLVAEELEVDELPLDGLVVAGLLDLATEELDLGG